MKIAQLIFFGFLLVCSSCGADDQQKKQKDMLVGKWDLVEGRRNGQLTQSLEGTVFEFSNDGKMYTNLPIPGGADSSYKIEENVVIQTVINDIKINYLIEELTQESLKLSTQLRGYDFNFVLEKSNMKSSLTQNMD